MKTISKFSSIYWIWAAIIVFLLPLAAHSYIGSFTRYNADDFCKAAWVNDLGIWGTTVYLYNSIEGVFTHSVAAALSNAAGLWLVSVWPTIVILSWSIGLTWAIREIMIMVEGVYSWKKASLLALALLYAIFELTPNYFQILYWQNGIVKYTLPSILGMYFLAYCIHWFNTHTIGRPTWPWLITCSLLALISAGFSETYLAVQLSALGITLLAGLFLLPKNRLPAVLLFMVCGLASSIFAFIIILAAPGNIVRQATFQEQIYTSISSLGNAIAYFTTQFTFNFLQKNPVVLLVVVFIAVLVAFKTSRELPLAQFNRPQQQMVNFTNIGVILLLLLILIADRLGIGGPPGLGLRQVMLLIITGVIAILTIMLRMRLFEISEIIALTGLLVITLVLVTVSFIPATYTLSHPGPLRSHLIPTFLLVYLMAVVGYFIGRAFRRLQNYQLRIITNHHFFRVIIQGSFLLLALVPLYKTWNIIQMAPEVRQYAARWDAQDEIVRSDREMGQMDQKMDVFGFNGGTAIITDDPDYWVNRCIAEYYGLNTIVLGDKYNADFPFDDWRGRYTFIWGK
jgi:hypothetical protein